MARAQGAKRRAKVRRPARPSAVDDNFYAENRQNQSSRIEPNGLVITFGEHTLTYNTKSGKVRLTKGSENLISGQVRWKSVGSELMPGTALTMSVELVGPGTTKLHASTAVTVLDPATQVRHEMRIGSFFQTGVIDIAARGYTEIPRTTGTIPTYPYYYFALAQRILKERKLYEDAGPALGTPTNKALCLLMCLQAWIADGCCRHTHLGYCCLLAALLTPACGECQKY